MLIYRLPRARTSFNRRSAGFSLIEMAVVLLIIGLLLGGLVMPLTAKMDSQNFKSTENTLEEIREALMGYALANDGLPCPATPASNGLAAVSGGGCTRQHGFVPAVTLGLNGPQNQDRLLLDAWSNPVRYSVSNADFDGDGNWDFTVPGEMSDVQLPNLTPDLDVCTTAAGSSATTTITATAPVVIYSMGKDWANFSSSDQQENVGANVGGGPSGQTYPVGADQVFVMRTQSTASSSEFDDLVTWISPNTLYGRMVSAGRLP